MENISNNTSEPPNDTARNSSQPSEGDESSFELANVSPSPPRSTSSLSSSPPPPAPAPPISDVSNVVDVGDAHDQQQQSQLALVAPNQMPNILELKNELRLFREKLTKDIVRATQYGDFVFCKQLIDNGQYDVNQRDLEDVTLLHWAAINNRIELVKYFLSKGAEVNAIGGDLHSTPLHWSTRQGHLGMIVLLMSHQADPTLYDGDGFNCLHLAAQFNHTSIVAYFVAKGVDVNIPDLNGMTPLMWSAFRCHS